MNIEEIDFNEKSFKTFRIYSTVFCILALMIPVYVFFQGEIAVNEAHIGNDWKDITREADPRKFYIGLGATCLIPAVCFWFRHIIISHYKDKFE